MWLEKKRKSFFGCVARQKSPTRLTYLTCLIKKS